MVTFFFGKIMACVGTTCVFPTPPSDVFAFKVACLPKSILYLHARNYVTIFNNSKVKVASSTMFQIEYGKQDKFRILHRRPIQGVPNT